MKTQKKEAPKVIKSVFQPSWPSPERMNELAGVKTKSGLSVFYKRTIIDKNDVMSLSVTDQKDVAAKMWGKCSVSARTYLMNCDFIAVAEAAHESAKKEAKKIHMEAKAAANKKKAVAA